MSSIVTWGELLKRRQQKALENNEENVTEKIEENLEDDYLNGETDTDDEYTSSVDDASENDTWYGSSYSTSAYGGENIGQKIRCQVLNTVR